MIVRPYDDIGPEAWDDFCLRAPDAWFFHTSRWLAYQEARGYEDLSFGLVDRSGVVAICPLMAGEFFLFEGHPGPWPVCSDERQAAVVSSRISALAKIGGTASAAFRSCPLMVDPHPILGFKNSLGWTSRVMKLQKPGPLREGIRKSYKAIINKGLRELVITDDPHQMRTCRGIHRIAAGRETRSIKTWDMMEQWAKEGYGITLVAYKEDCAIGFAYFILYKNTAYYAAAAALEPHVGHTLLWFGVELLNRKGVDVLEIGWQGQAKDEKGKNIEMFKRGFPGDDIPIMIAERKF